MRSAALGLIGLAVGGLGFACQSYNMEEVDPQTVVAVEKSGTFTAGKPPALLVLQDRSGSMEICFGSGGAAGERCNDAGTTVSKDGSSRMHISQRVMTKAVSTHGADVLFGLLLYGVDGVDPACGDPLEIAAPGSDTVGKVVDAYQSHEKILQPAGGTPTTKALRRALEVLVEPGTGKLKMADRDNYVVLVTDGLMNCNIDHAMPCICAQETGCQELDSNREATIGEEGTFADARMCLDDANSLAAVQQLRAAGVKTFVIGLGESFTGGGNNLGVVSLNALAEAGGAARDDGGEKFYSAANEADLEASISEIIGKINVPCEYELDGPVCDGRLVNVTLELDGQQVLTSCGTGDETWQFAQRENGTLDPKRVTFSPDLCGRFKTATTAKISIKGIESGCEEEDGVIIGPACDLRDLDAAP